jgi:hypothetical protein
MPSVDAWSTNSFPLADWLDDVDRGVDTALLISEQPVSIVVRRGAGTLAAQTVRIDALRQPRQIQAEGGVVITAEALVVGYAGHPTITDTDLQPGDRFVSDGRAYEIVGLLPALEDALHALAMIRD